jgi:site-specific DNA recombinase
MLESEFRARGIKVEYVSAQFDTSTHYGRFIRNVMGSVDELDHEQIVHQLVEGRRQAVKKGSVVVTRPPFGYTIVKEETATGRIIRKLEIVEEEAKIVRLIYFWYVYGEGSGPLSITAIATKLTEQRVPTRWDTAIDRRGKIGLKKKKNPVGIWETSTVYEILHSKTYMGKWAWGKTKTVQRPGSDKTKQIPLPESEWVWVDVPAIIDEELFLLAQKQAEENNRLSPRHKKYTYLFTGMLTCEKCRRAYNGCRYSDTAPFHYRCGGKRGNSRWIEEPCDRPNWLEDDIDSVIWPWIKDIVKNPERVESALEARQLEAQHQNSAIMTLVRAAEKLIEELRVEQERVMTLYKKGKLDEARWEVEDSAYTRQIAEQEEQKVKLLNQLTKPLRSVQQLDDIKHACAIIAKGIDYFTREEKREVYELLCLKAELGVEGEDRTVNAECILDAKKLTLKAQKDDEGGPSFGSSSTRLWPALGHSTRWRRRSARQSPAAAEPAIRARSSTRRTRIFAWPITGVRCAVWARLFGHLRRCDFPGRRTKDQRRRIAVIRPWSFVLGQQTKTSSARD